MISKSSTFKTNRESLSKFKDFCRKKNILQKDGYKIIVENFLAMDTAKKEKLHDIKEDVADIWLGNSSLEMDTWRRLKQYCDLYGIKIGKVLSWILIHFVNEEMALNGDKLFHTPQPIMNKTKKTRRVLPTPFNLYEDDLCEFNELCIKRKVTKVDVIHDILTDFFSKDEEQQRTVREIEILPREDKKIIHRSVRLEQKVWMTFNLHCMENGCDTKDLFPKIVDSWMSAIKKDEEIIELTEIVTETSPQQEPLSIIEQFKECSREEQQKVFTEISTYIFGLEPKQLDLFEYFKSKDIDINALTYYNKRLVSLLTENGHFK